MKGNILLVGLDYSFVKCVGTGLAEKLDLFFLDVNDLIEYRIIDKEKMQIVCGMEYFEKKKRNVIFEISDYENTIVNIPYDIVLNKEYKEVLKKSTLIFLNFNKELLEKFNKSRKEENKLDIELITYEELTKLLLELADYSVIVESENIEKNIESISNLKIFN